MEKSEVKDILKELREEEKAEKEKEEKEKNAELDIEELTNSITEKIVGAIKEAKDLSDKDAKDLKKDLFNPENGYKGIGLPSLDQVDKLSGDDKILAFFKTLIVPENPEAQQVLRALVEGTAADGGYLVPEELATEVWRILPDYTVMRKLARVIPMNTDSLKLNKLTAMPEAYWTSEYARKTTSSADFGQIELNPHKLVCLLPVTQELIADANINIVRFIEELFAERIGHKEDQAYFTGTGTGQPTGLMTSLGTGVNAGGAINFDHIISMIYRVPQSVRGSKRAAFVAPANMFKSLRRIKDTTNNYIWSPGRPDNGMVDSLYGYPLYEQNALAHNQMVFGDFAYYIIGDRQQLTVMTTLEGGDAWRRDSMEIKAKVRVDGEVILTNAFCKLING